MIKTVAVIRYCCDHFCRSCRNIDDCLLCLFLDRFRLFSSRRLCRCFCRHFRCCRLIYFDVASLGSLKMDDFLIRCRCRLFRYLFSRFLHDDLLRDLFRCPWIFDDL